MNPVVENAQSKTPIWVVTPSYFDVSAFRQIHREMTEIFDEPASGNKYLPRFVYVDDSGGGDPDVADLEKLPGDSVQIVTPPYNLGHQGALVYALRKLSKIVRPTDIILTMDGDGEDRPQDVQRLISALMQLPAGSNGVVIAKRTRRRESFLFKMFYMAFKFFFFLLTGVAVRSGNFAAFYGRFLDKLVFHPHFDFCYSSTLLSLDLKRVFVPCERGRRYAGKSKMNFLRLAMHGIRMLMPFMDRIAVRAFTLFVFTFLLGVAAAISIAMVKFFTTAAIPGWATYTTIMSLMLSFIAISNFIVLFFFFSQNQSISVRGMDHD